MNYSKCQIYCDASMTIFTSILSPILVSKYAGYFGEQIKDKNDMKKPNNFNCTHSAKCEHSKYNRKENLEQSGSAMLLMGTTASLGIQIS